MFLIQELELLNMNNEPLTHAQYHKEEVREAGERMRRPCSLEISEELEEKMREYLARVCCLYCLLFTASHSHTPAIVVVVAETSLDGPEEN